MKIRTSLLLLSTATALSACDPITLGLGLGGGYVASREVNKSQEKKERAVDRRIEREQQYYQEQDRSQAQASDQQIATQMTFGMLGGGLTNVLSITADVRGGVVTLYGTVPSPTVADRAVDIARRTPGVREVVSRLNIMEMQITPTGKAWGHVAAPVQQRQQPPEQQRQAPSLDSPPQAGQRDMPPESIPQGQQALPPVVAYPEHQPAFAPITQEQPSASAVPPQPITPPEQQPMQQPMQGYGQQPPAALPEPQQNYGQPQQYVEPPYQRPQFQEPEGTQPRTLPGVEQQH